VCLLRVAGGELLAAALPASHVYKAFNTIGTSVLGAPDGVGVPVTM
jgi:predicted dinucleotide-binding enzyme